MGNRTIRCLLSRKFYDYDIAYIEKRLSYNVELLIPHNYDSATLTNFIQQDVEIVLGTVPEAEVLDKASALKLIQVPWAGVENINFPLLKNYSFALCNSHSNALLVAELAVSLMLSLLKGIIFHDAKFREGNWCRPSLIEKATFLPPIQINGKTIGIVGYGAIGKEIHSLLKGFGVNCLAIANHYYSTEDVDIWGCDKLYAVLTRADIVFVSVPLTDQTRNLIDGQAFKQMKNTSYLINMSRGAIVNEQALFNALSTNMIAGAAIDTWYNYPERGTSVAQPSKYPFNKLTNVVMSPHRAGFGKNLLPHMDDAIENINRYASRQELINVIDLEKTY